MRQFERLPHTAAEGAAPLRSLRSGTRSALSPTEVSIMLNSVPWRMESRICSASA